VIENKCPKCGTVGKMRAIIDVCITGIVPLSSGTSTGVDLGLISMIRYDTGSIKILALDCKDCNSTFYVNGLPSVYPPKQNGKEQRYDDMKGL